RKYQRFRGACFYGGIATADCVGCGLCCIFCWSWRQITEPEKYGRLHTPVEVVDCLIAIGPKIVFSQIRISGIEPTHCRQHLLEILSLTPREFRFIHETNGILLGQEAGYRDIVLVTGDGGRGYPKLAPFDRISMTAACREILPPLLDQFCSDGRLIAPVQLIDVQIIISVVKKARGFARHEICEVLYVPMRGQ
ncbi:MAG: hypothetical protein ACWGN1_07015, partial [Desulfobulbales bacterium]